MKIIFGILIGALLTGPAVWFLKPSAIDSMALGFLQSRADEKAAAQKAIYETKLEELEAKQEVAQVKLDDETVKRVDAERTANQNVKLFGNAKKEAVIADLAELHSQMILESTEDELEKYKQAFFSLRTANERLRKSNRLFEAHIDIRENLLNAITNERDALVDRLEVSEERRILAEERISQLDGRRLRIGPGTTAGFSPLGGSLIQRANVVIGITFMWG